MGSLDFAGEGGRGYEHGFKNDLSDGRQENPDL